MQGSFRRRLTPEQQAILDGSRGGFNTLASFRTPMMMGDKKVKCSDQNNPDLYKKPMIGKALCLMQTIGSTTGAWRSIPCSPPASSPHVCCFP